MIHIFVDFEMNTIQKAKRAAGSKVKNEIVEIGAVKLNDQYQIIDRFSSYVKPELNEITATCTKITGITSASVANAPLLKDALQTFISWIQPQGDQEIVRFYSWSYIDRSQLYGECFLKDIYEEEMPKVFRRWMDFQRVYTRLVGLTRSLSLTNAIGCVQYEFQGTQHSALADSENAANLLTLVKDRSKFEEHIRLVRNTLKPQSQMSTLGDILGKKLISDMINSSSAAI